MSAENERILVIAPHPDDESLAAGSYLAKALKAGAAVKIIFLTSGEGNTLGHMRWKKRLFISAKDELEYGEIRRAEARAAMAALGEVETEFWDYCDTGLFEHLADGENVITAALEKAIGAFRPSVLIFPSGQDLHRDHSAACLMTEFALNRLGTRGIKPLRYVNHGADRLSEDYFNFSEEISAEEGEAKWKLLKAYESQVSLQKRNWHGLCRRPERFIENEEKIAPEFLLEFSGPDLLWVRSRFGYSKLNPVSLYLVGADASGVKKCFYGKIRSGKRLRLREFSGRNAQAEIEVQRANGTAGCFLKLPRALFDGCDRVFIKARRKLSFFDDSGFACIPLKQEERRQPRTVAVMPCYNIAAQAKETARRTLKHADLVIAVDDGSSDGTGEMLLDLAAREGPGLKVVRLKENRGKGGALAEGISLALARKPEFDLLVCLDGDLQHRPEDIERFKAAWRNGADFVAGRRAFRMDAPLRSRLGNNFINWLARRFFSNVVSDTQSGFRGFSYGLLAELKETGEIGGGRYEAELRALLAIMRKNSRVLELDIPAIYLDKNRTSHFRPLIDSANIIYALLKLTLFRLN